MRAGDPTRLGSQGIPKVYRSAFVAVKIPQALLCYGSAGKGPEEVGRADHSLPIPRYLGSGGGGLKSAVLQR